ncbi:MAG TPA: hypothetical protein VKC60_03490 [Opitutaceae bacterium]|nr:hypothetical protein [Opitutaceae bacterium]
MNEQVTEEPAEPEGSGIKSIPDPTISPEQYAEAQKGHFASPAKAAETPQEEAPPPAPQPAENG